MTKSKSKKPKEPTWCTVNFLAAKFHADTRTLRRIVEGLPSKLIGRWKHYREADVKAIIAENRRIESVSGILRDQKLSEEIRKLRIRNDRDEAKFIEKAKVVEVMRRIQSRLIPPLEAKLLVEYPAAVAGLNDPAAIRNYSRRVFDSILEIHHQFSSEWATLS